MSVPAESSEASVLTQSSDAVQPSPRVNVLSPTSPPSLNGNTSEEHVYTGENSSTEDRTVIGDGFIDAVPATSHHHGRQRSNSHLTAQSDYDPHNPLQSIKSAQSRDQRFRFDDDLEMLKVERQVSRWADSSARGESKSRDAEHARRRQEQIDEFDIATNPVHEQAQNYKPVEHPSSQFGKFIKQVHGSNWLVRYFTYIAPPAFVLLIPLLLGALKYKNATVGGVYLLWFMIWLEIVWLTLWAGRILAKCLPWPIGLFSSLFTNNSKKWRDMGKQLELPATLFFWWLAIEISFLPTMTYHQKGHPHGHVASWMNSMNKVLVSFFVGFILNFVAKIIIQLIAISFHLRTYADRIEINKFQIGSLTKLYKFSKDKIAMDDSEFDNPEARPASGTLTPGRLVTEAAKRTKQGFSKFGDVAGKIAGDFTGRQTMKSTHPSQVVLTLLSSTNGSQCLARRMYRTYAPEGQETIGPDDLRAAFDNDEEVEAAFSMFDKDLNGDISMEELEAVCVEIGRERKGITASLKDLDSVVGRLDNIFMFIVFVITVLVFLSLISTSAAGVLASAGSAVLALSWLLSATAQEFLQSLIFVFCKHPFDCGDRVTIYGNTGASLSGDDYFVKEISLLYTEFKKMEGHVVQAPNSYLNTLFILNHRRSGGLAEAVTITIKFGTTLEQIEGLRNRLLEFVKSEKREYQGNILTELRDIVDVYSLHLNVIFFYKSSWQNEGLRLARRNKFICALMVSMQEMGIEGPMARLPGQQQSFPLYLQNVPHVKVPGIGHSGHANAPHGLVPDESYDRPHDPPFVSPAPDVGHYQTEYADGPPSSFRRGSILRHESRARGESLSQMNKRVDFSLGASAAALDNFSGDVFESRERSRIPIEVAEASRERQQQENLRASLDAARHGASIDNPIGRSTSRDDRFGSLNRRATEGLNNRWRAGSGAGGSVHRNRFFGRYRAGTVGDDQFLENGMADIPENGGPQATPLQRLDPRTGMISPQAVTPGFGQSPHLRPHVQPPPRVDGHGSSLQEAIDLPVSPATIYRRPEVETLPNDS